MRARMDARVPSRWGRLHWGSWMVRPHGRQAATPDAVIHCVHGSWCAWGTYAVGGVRRSISPNGGPHAPAPLNNGPQCACDPVNRRHQAVAGMREGLWLGLVWLGLTWLGIMCLGPGIQLAMDAEFAHVRDDPESPLFQGYRHPLTEAAEERWIRVWAWALVVLLQAVLTGAFVCLLRVCLQCARGEGLVLAATNGNESRVRELLRQRQDTHANYKGGQALVAEALAAAAAGGHNRITRLLRDRLAAAARRADALRWVCVRYGGLPVDLLWHKLTLGTPAMCMRLLFPHSTLLHNDTCMLLCVMVRRHRSGPNQWRRSHKLCAWYVCVTVASRLFISRLPHDLPHHRPTPTSNAAPPHHVHMSCTATGVVSPSSRCACPAPGACASGARLLFLWILCQAPAVCIVLPMPRPTLPHRNMRV
jgi:hypothetical protein